MFNSNPTYYVAYSQMASLVYGGILLILVPVLLSPVQQGYWFTMMALGASARLADMGYLSLVLTFVGYSYSEKTKFTFSSLKFFIDDWRNKVLMTIFPIIFILGFFVLLLKADGTFKIYFSWLIYVISLGLLFYSLQKVAILEGLGYVKQAHIYKGTIYILAVVFTVFLLLKDFNIYALGGGFFLATLLVSFALGRNHLINRKYDNSNNFSTDLNNEFMGLIKKTAASWIGGYLGTHAMVPLSYLLLGPVVSGALGATFNIFVALQNLANVFLIANISKVTNYMANSNIDNALNTVKVSLLKSLFLFTMTNIVFWIGYYMVGRLYIGNRLLDGWHLPFLFFGFLMQHIIYAISIYIRSKKREPFSLMSIVTSLIMVLVMLAVIGFFNSDWYFAGFAVSSFIALIWAIKIYRQDQHV